MRRAVAAAGRLGRYPRGGGLAAAAPAAAAAAALGASPQQLPNGFRRWSSSVGGDGDDAAALAVVAPDGGSDASVPKGPTLPTSLVVPPHLAGLLGADDADVLVSASLKVGRSELPIVHMPEELQRAVQVAVRDTVGPGGYCSSTPRHRMPFNARDEVSKCVG
jgi:hypothetical protein